MSKQKKPAEGKVAAKDRGPVLYLRLDDETEAALQSFISAQRVAPERTSVGLTALHEFLAREGYWPPKK